MSGSYNADQRLLSISPGRGGSIRDAYSPDKIHIDRVRRNSVLSPMEKTMVCHTNIPIERM